MNVPVVCKSAHACQDVVTEEVLKQNDCRVRQDTMCWFITGVFVCSRQMRPGHD